MAISPSASFSRSPKQPGFISSTSMEGSRLPPTNASPSRVGPTRLAGIITITCTFRQCGALRIHGDADECDRSGGFSVQDRQRQMDSSAKALRTSMSLFVHPARIAPRRPVSHGRTPLASPTQPTWRNRIEFHPTPVPRKEQHAMKHAFLGLALVGSLALLFPV